MDLIEDKRPSVESNNTGFILHFRHFLMHTANLNF